MKEHFDILVELVGLDKALKFYELREDLGMETEEIDEAALILLTK